MVENHLQVIVLVMLVEANLIYYAILYFIQFYEIQIIRQKQDNKKGDYIYIYFM